MRIKDAAQDRLSTRINNLPKWARDYIHEVHTFVGVQEQKMPRRDAGDEMTMTRAFANIRAAGIAEKTCPATSCQVTLVLS